MWKCSKCEAMVEDTEKLCPVCGEACPEEEATEDVEELTTPVAEETEEVEADFEENEEVEDVEEDFEETEEVEDAEEDFEETEENFEDVVTFDDEPLVWVCETCGAECDGDVCPECGQERPEDEMIVDFVPKKNNKIYGFVIAVAVVVAITVGIFTFFFLNRNVDKTGEGNTITYADIDNSIDCIIGSDTALKINGMDVPSSVFEALYATTAVLYQQEYCVNQYTGMEEISKLDNFKWTDIADKETNETHRQKVIAKTINTCNQVYSLLSLGEQFGVAPSQVELEKVDEQIEQQKASYGKEFEKLIKLSGYKNVDQYKEILIMDTKYQAVIADMENNPDRYIGEDTSKYNNEFLSTVSLKPILIYFEEEEEIDEDAEEAEADAEETDTEEAEEPEEKGLTPKEAKKKAEEVVKKANKGKDFDKLMDEYSENGTSSQDPITISRGSMIKQFPGVKEFENFEKVAFALKVNEVSKPVKAPNGYFVLKRVATISDATAYAIETSKVSVNKSFIDDLKITVSYKKLYDESNK